LFLFLTLVTPLHAQMTELPIPFAPWELTLPEGEGFLTRTSSRFSAGVILYDSFAQSFRWSGFGEGEIILLSVDPVHWEWRLSMETTADDRNEIYFRLLRLYYQALTGVRISLRKNHFIFLGYQHRCSHGADGAEEGRILIRSGPNLSYLSVHSHPRAEFRFSLSFEPTLLGQNADSFHQPRYLFSGRIEAEGKALPLMLSLGIGAFGITSGARETFHLLSPYYRHRTTTTLNLSLGQRFRGKDGILTILLRYSTIPDSGLNTTTSPLRWLGFYFLFDH
jgi:hypothetical protein